MILNIQEKNAFLWAERYKKSRIFYGIVFILIVLTGICECCFFFQSKSNFVIGITLIIAGMAAFFYCYSVGILYGILVKESGKRYSIFDNSDLYSERNMSDGYSRDIKQYRMNYNKGIYKEELRRIIDSCGTAGMLKSGQIPSIEELKTKGLSDEDLYDLGLISYIILSKKEQAIIKIAKALEKYWLLIYKVFFALILVGIVECILRISDIRAVIGLCFAALILFLYVFLGSFLAFYGIRKNLKKDSLYSAQTSSVLSRV